MILDRKNPPNTIKVDKLIFPAFDTLITNNGEKIYALNSGNEPVMRLDFVFNASLLNQTQIGISSFTSKMLSEGSKNKTAFEIAESLDYYGSYFQTKSNADDSVATLYCLEKHLSKCLPIFLDAISNPIFPKKELDTLKKNSLQRLLINEKKDNFLCKKEFAGNLYGVNHPYASYTGKEEIEAINSENLAIYHNEFYLKGLKYILLSGKFTNLTINEVFQSVESSPFLASNAKDKTPEIHTNKGKQFFAKVNSVQSAIRIGKISIARTHPDFRKLQLLNLIFGGYFGSRLMKNIREDKGLTYGIYSSIEVNKLASSWYIETDINTKNRDKGITEIYNEMNSIQEDLISSEELNQARNYYLGSFLRSLDGPFSLADRLKIIIDFNLPENYYPSIVEDLNNITSTELQNMANKYLNLENLVEIVVGKP